MSRRLIVTADDYGMCDTVNQAIEECLEAGTVRSTCVMVNMPANSHTASLRARFPHLSLGIHWTLTEGRPILPPSQVQSLVHRDGSFLSPAQLRRRWLRRQIRATELQAELRAQYRCFYDMVGESDFWTTHQNFHVFPGLFSLCVELGQELHIPTMRSHRRITVPRTQSPTAYHLCHPLPWVKGRVISWWASRAEERGMLMPDGMVHMPGYEADQVSLEEVVTRLPWSSIEQTVELVVHPATTSQEAFFHRHAKRRVVEYQLYRDPRLVKRLEDIGVEAADFGALQVGA